MVDTDLVSLPEWSGVITESTVTRKGVLELAELCLPNEVCETLGPEGIELAVASGILGPPEVSRLILHESHLFSEDYDLNEQTKSEKTKNTRTTNSLEMTPEATGSLPETSQYSLTSVVFLVLMICRFSITLIPVPHIVEFLVSYTLILAISTRLCSSFQPQKSFFLTTRRWCSIRTTILTLSKITFHGFLLFSILLFVFSLVMDTSSVLDEKTNALFSSSWVVCLSALLVMVLSYTESYMLRLLLTQWLALTAIVLNGLQSCPPFYEQKVNDDFYFLQPITALTLVLALTLSAIMAETTKFKKSYS
eukprot:g563.t1